MIVLVKLVFKEYCKLCFKNFYVVNEEIILFFLKIDVFFFYIMYIIFDFVGIVFEISEGFIVYIGDFKFD